MRLSRIIPRTFKGSLVFLLSAQMAFSPLASVSWAKDETEERELLQKELLDTPEQHELNEMADRMQNGQDIPLTDPFHLMGQYVEVYDGHDKPISTYSLDVPGVGLPPLAYTSLNARFNPETKMLILEAERGANEKGEHGQLVARHYIPNFNIASLARDDEMLAFIDDQGHIDVMDWGFVVQAAFHEKIPIATDAWKPKTALNLNGHKVTTTYLTEGVVPFQTSDLAPDAVIQLDENNQPVLRSGDLMVTVDGKVIGVFDRAGFHKQIALAQAILVRQAKILSQTAESIPSVSADLKQQEHDMDEFDRRYEELEQATTLDPALAMAVHSMGQYAGALQARVQEHLRFSERENGIFNLKEWSERFEIIRRTAEKQNADLSVVNLERDWQKYAGDHPFVDEEENINKLPASFYIKWAAIATAVTAAMAAPAAIEHFQLQNIAAMNFIYSHAPAVLKDAQYRWPLIYGSIFLTSVWPAAIGASVAAKKGLEFLNQRYQDSKTGFGRKIRDIAKEWIDLKPFQRINSFGMRKIYSEITLGVHITLAERLASQKALFTAINNGLNPFKRVLPESPEGKKVGITKPTYLGFNNPFQSRASLHDDVVTKIKLQSEEFAKKQRLKAHAWLLAAVVVAEKYDIDLSTLLEMEGKAAPTLKDLRALYENPDAAKHWEDVTVELQKHILELPFDAGKGEMQKVSISLLQEQYQKAKEVAEKLNAMTDSEKTLRKLRMKFKKWSLARVFDVVNLGRETYTFFKSIHPNDYVSAQVEREFVPDHLLCVYLIALVGGRADLSRPQDLAASMTFPWTTPAHLTDMGNNLYIHFFVAAARTAYLYQRIKPKEESTYKPWEDITVGPYARPSAWSRLKGWVKGINPLSSAQQENAVAPQKGAKKGEPNTRQAFLPGLKRWTADTLNPLKSDLAGTLWRGQVRQIRMVQAFFLTNMLLRMFPPPMFEGGQTFSHALMGTMFCFLAGVWYISPFWLPAQAGNNAHQEFFQAVNERIRAARRHLLWAKRETNPEKREDQMLSSSAEMMALYAQYKPDALNDLDIAADLEGQVDQLIELSQKTPPVEQAPNSFLMEIPTLFGAFASTYAAIPMMVKSYDPNFLNAGSLLEWLGITTAGMAAVYWGFSAKAWSIYLPILQAKLGALKERLQPALDKAQTAKEKLALLTAAATEANSITQQQMYWAYADKMGTSEYLPLLNGITGKDCSDYLDGSATPPDVGAPNALVDPPGFDNYRENLHPHDVGLSDQPNPPNTTN